MNIKYNKFVIIIFFVALILSGLFYFRYQVYYSHGKFSGTKTLEIAKGDGNKEVATKLKEVNLISGEIYFYYYIKSQKNKVFSNVGYRIFINYHKSFRIYDKKNCSQMQEKLCFSCHCNNFYSKKLESFLE